MQVPKLLVAAVVFAIVLVSVGFFLSQTAKPAIAQNTKITGTIVLADSSSATNASTFVLPGGVCDVEIVGCGSKFVVLDSRRGFPLLNQAVGLLNKNDGLFPGNIVESDELKTVYYLPENGKNDIGKGTTPQEALNDIGYPNCSTIMDIYTYGDNQVYNCNGLHFFVTKRPTQLNSNPPEMFYAQKLMPGFVDGPKTQVSNGCYVFFGKGIPAQNYSITSTINGGGTFSSLAVSYSCT